VQVADQSAQETRVAGRDRPLDPRHIVRVDRPIGAAQRRRGARVAMGYRLGDVTLIGHAGLADMKTLRESVASTPGLARGQMTAP
jgi:hypothetical protein